jgi:hypothetical protein
MKACIWRFSLPLAVLALVGNDSNSALAVSSSSPGLAWSWGDNQYGQLGNKQLECHPGAGPGAYAGERYVRHDQRGARK